jgi:hypothetical protein
MKRIRIDEDAHTALHLLKRKNRLKNMTDTIWFILRSDYKEEGDD